MPVPPVIAGIDWNLVVPGVRLSLGGAEVEITAYATPCKNIQDSFAGRNIARVSQKVNPGWSRVYARVVRDAEVRVGDEAAVLP